MKHSVIILAAATGILLSPLSAAEAGGGISAYLGDTRGEYEYPDFEDIGGSATVTGLAARLDLNKFVSVELGLMDMGSFEEDYNLLGFSDEIETSFTHLSAIARLPLSESVALRGRLGMASWDVDETFTTPGGASKDNDSGSDAFYGAGIEARFSDAVSASAEYQILEFSPELFGESGDISYRTFLLGLHFHF